MTARDPNDPGPPCPTCNDTGLVIAHYSETSGAHSMTPCHCQPPLTTNRVISAPSGGKVRSDLDHPSCFKTGTRIMLLKSRHKDGYVGKERAIMRQSNDVDQFDALLEELRSLMRPHERIYASASERDLGKAGRIFMQRFVHSTYDPPEVRDDFHRRIPYHWYSSLMQPESQIRENKWWMFDCDDPGTAFWVRSFFTRPEVTNDQNKIIETYTYNTKSGSHILCRPFNRGLIDVPEMLKVLDLNPLMLWSWT